MSERLPEADVLADFDQPGREAREQLVLDLDGFEGPLDLLLKLARDQKVDLTKISILELAEQYLAFVEATRLLSLELAADYLVMAAWLAYLKSRLLLPQENETEPSGEELAFVLAQRLRRLEAMRDAGRRLMARSRLGVEIFARGMPEPVVSSATVTWDANLYDVLSSYAALRLHRIAQVVQMPKRHVFSLQEARDRLTRLLGGSTHWAPLDSYLLDYLPHPELKRSARASALSASLELAREGAIELKQSEHFAPVYVRRRMESDLARPEAASG